MGQEEVIPVVMGMQTVQTVEEMEVEVEEATGVGVGVAIDVLCVGIDLQTT